MSSSVHFALNTIHIVNFWAKGSGVTSTSLEFALNFCCYDYFSSFNKDDSKKNIHNVINQTILPTSRVTSFFLKLNFPNTEKMLIWQRAQEWRLIMTNRVACDGKIDWFCIAFHILIKTTCFAYFDKHSIPFTPHHGEAWNIFCINGVLKHSLWP